jgi:hypothetical protein
LTAPPPLSILPATSTGVNTMHKLQPESKLLHTGAG